jgi:hypothetical protein
MRKPVGLAVGSADAPGRDVAAAARWHQRRNLVVGRDPGGLGTPGIDELIPEALSSSVL